jgi:hypothetical protein
VYLLRFSYILRSPEFQTVIIFIASPVTLAVALWGMTTNPMINNAAEALLPCSSAGVQLAEHRTPFAAQSTGKARHDETAL